MLTEEEKRKRRCEYSKRYRERNKLVVREREKLYYETNREQLNAKKREYRRKNRDKILAYRRAYRARKRAEEKEKLAKHLNIIKTEEKQ